MDWLRRPKGDPARLAAVADSLDGLSVGDALGEQFFGWRHDVDDLRSGWLPDGPWGWTDDTCMAATLAAHVVAHDGVDQDRLADGFVRDFDISRGYGFGAVALLHEIRTGTPWRVAARSSFGGGGSYGNGSAMRVPPLGAWYAGDLAAAAEAAALSAEVTHAHPEGVAGAIAVAVVTAYVAGHRGSGVVPSAGAVLEAALAHTPDGDVADGLAHARSLVGAPMIDVAPVLGTGQGVSCQDTVPFVVWAAATSLADYVGAIELCIEGRGDVDTTCAMVGGIVGAFTGIGSRDDGGTPVRGVPLHWLEQREPLPRSVRRLRP